MLTDFFMFGFVDETEKLAMAAPRIARFKMRARRLRLFSPKVRVPGTPPSSADIKTRAEGLRRRFAGMKAKMGRFGKVVDEEMKSTIDQIRMMSEGVPGVAQEMYPGWGPEHFKQLHQHLTR